MKVEGRKNLSSRLTSLKQGPRVIEQGRQAIYIRYYDPIIWYPLDSIDRVEAAFRCAAGSV